MVSTMSYLADIRVNYIAAGAKFNSIGSFAFDLKTLDQGDIPITTEAQPDGTGGTYSPTFFTLGLHYSRALTDRISVGGTTHYIVNRIERVDGEVVDGDVFAAGGSEGPGIVDDTVDRRRAALNDGTEAGQAAGSGDGQGVVAAVVAHRVVEEILTCVGGGGHAVDTPAAHLLHVGRADGTIARHDNT